MTVGYYSGIRLYVAVVLCFKFSFQYNSSRSVVASSKTNFTVQLGRDRISLEVMLRSSAPHAPPTTLRAEGIFQFSCWMSTFK